MHAGLKPFVMVIADHDKEEFSVEGPMSDDTEWTEAVVKAQATGRNINCSTSTVSVTQAAESYAKTYGYTEVSSGSIVSVMLP
jgi:hypothetical protein